ncbi:hypothetical protein [Planococcus sp. ISL-109]|uniref:hypothetical protein n=1 Tax=Planococcus sp. ISL-109 TaxID=2819166 RepID=UPI001BEABDE5|nr:hypothetical protein [Planococcus sp. ISL-109]MBT2583419.1 hypothetical protein [Planococcus sp. ISL-109]
MTRKFVILLIVTGLLFLGFYFVITFYNSFVGGVEADSFKVFATAIIADHFHSASGP